MAAEAWRLLLDPPRPAAWNMAIDEALLLCADSGPPTLRLYAWERPSVSLGYRQKSPAWLGRCSAAGVEVVRRVTGGGAVVHAGDLTYGVTASRRSRALPGDLRGSYAWIRDALLAGLRAAGLEAGRSRGRPGAEWEDLCFAASTGFELDVEGLKLVGSAQRRTAWGLLQHGSIRLDDDTRIYRDVLECPAPARPRLPRVSRAHLTASIAASFAGAVGATLHPGRLNAAERRMACRRLASRDRDPLAAAPLVRERFSGRSGEGLEPGFGPPGDATGGA